MDSRAIAFAIPGFFLLIAVELFVNRARGDSRYRFHDSITSLSCGVGQQVLDVSIKSLVVGGYVFVLRHAHVFSVSMRSVAGWIAITLLVDLLYYAFHRASHRINALWAMHAVHHQSEEYNLSTALRQSWFDPLVEWTFYLPLAVLGFPVEMYLLALTFNRIYQFLIHTRSIKTLGPLEWVLNTPSHHRVHHGIDPEYIDKNYGGIFIVWDRMFGSFQREGREPIYGTVKPLASWNAAWANVAEWVRIAALARGTRRWSDRVRAWFMPPEWRPGDLGGRVVVPEVDRAAYKKFDVRVPRGVNRYVLLSFAFVSAATTLLLYQADETSLVTVSLVALAIGLSIVGWGALMEGRRRGVWIEWVRLACAVAAVAWIARGLVHGAVVLAGAALAAVAMGAWVLTFRARLDAKAKAADRASMAMAA